MANRNLGPRNMGMNRRQFLKTTGVGAVGIVGAAMMGSSVVRAQPPQGTKLQEIIARNKLKVLLPPDVIYGFTSTDTCPYGYPTPWGIEPDLGRALAAAIFNVDENIDDYIEWVYPTDYDDRFTRVREGAADVGFAVATNTLSRDAALGVDFAPTYFYDGQNIFSTKELADITHIGTIVDTTGVDIAPTLGKAWTAYDSQDSMVQAYKNAEIDAMLTDSSSLIAIAISEEFSEGSLILTTPLSKEPLAPFYKENEAAFGDVVRWVMYALFEAENKGYTKLGIVGVPSQWLGVHGPKIGLQLDWAYCAVMANGNYKEIYERNLQEDAWYVGGLKPNRGANNLSKNGGLIYPLQIR